MSNTDVRYSSVNDEIEIEIEQTETPSPVSSRPVSGGPPFDHIHSLDILSLPIFACVFYTLVLITISVYDLIRIRWDLNELAHHFNITL
jgi:hypothetical protein